MRCTRSVTAGGDIPTLRASADIVERGAAGNSSSSRRFTGSVSSSFADCWPKPVLGLRISDN
jgi:hypothetical protein